MISNRKPANYVDQSQIDILEKELNEIGDKFPYLKSLGEAELQRLRGGIADYVDLFSNKKVKVRAKVHIPVEQYPSINFVGKLLGPGASTLRGIQEQTNTKMTILGAGVLKNANGRNEDNIPVSKVDKKVIQSTTKQKLHLQIDSLGTPAEAYYRLSHALIEVQNCMVHELPRGIIQTYHPVTAFNWNSYMFNSAAYDSYMNNGYKTMCRNSGNAMYNGIGGHGNTSGNGSNLGCIGNGGSMKYRNPYNNFKSKKFNSNVLEYESMSHNTNATKNHTVLKNGPSGDEPIESDHVSNDERAI